jgi:3-methylcrotonyl-CoA carboxylase alpha subunit
MTIRKLLIANRGEIAVRIARTARRMGIRTVAVFSSADRGAPHVLACDEAVPIGPPPASGSYLRAERLLEAARLTGADAVHPGYGFLSESPDFAEAVAAAGLAWVGPSAEAIRAMGLKDSAKRLMEAAGVPVTPGYHGDRQEGEFLAARAGEIGFPVLIKAAAGGGGKGMRRVDRAEDFAPAIERARSEALSSFGNDRVLVEKLIERPRHIEVQVFADAHGRTVHLFERDCSAQRRHQKVIEEAPAPGMTAALREAMTRAAVRAAEAVGYVGAGTVEFIVDGGRMDPESFFFMEMNTRLQVEHPVTEAITGLDLVEWQLRVAGGEPLPRAQEEIALRGHAVEARLYAEDPAADFRPQTGRLAALVLPASARVDSGVAEGQEITPHYDPMIAKVIAHGETREAAFARLSDALAETHAAGVTTNIAFLERLAADPGMRAGDLDTRLIARRIGALTAAPEPTAADLALAAAALADRLPPGPLEGWRAWGIGWSHRTLETPDGPVEIAFRAEAEDGATRIRAETPLGAADLCLATLGGARWQVSEGAGPAHGVHLHRDPLGVTLLRRGGRLRLGLADPIAWAEAGEPSGDSVAAPLPGILKSLSAEPGVRVEAGEVLAVMEAMKMEHSLASPRAGTVAAVLAAPGETLAEGALIVALAPEEEA